MNKKTLKSFFQKLILRPRIIVFDDLFPVPTTTFRITEFNYYLKHFHNTEIISYISSEPSSFSKYKQEYSYQFPQFSERIHEFDPKKEYEADLAYTVFLNNAYFYLPVIERMQVPFVFTLYAGGGFHINQSESDAKLKKVMASPYFKKVIVTQKLTRDYILGNNFCEEKELEFVYGAVVDDEYLSRNSLQKKYYKKDKDTFDICFVAYKYMSKGSDKGYDIFIEVAKKLASSYPDIHFHIVGNFDESDIPIDEIKNKITFYGNQLPSFFPGFHSKMDIIISPNTPFVLWPGTFDGFPTGCCKDAAILGVAVFATDPLGLNFVFKPDRDLVIIKPDATSIVSDVERYYKEPEKLYRLSENGKLEFIKAFGIKTQMKKRVKVFNKVLYSLIYSF